VMMALFTLSTDLTKMDQLLNLCKKKNPKIKLRG
jgi:hypothetical protein